MANALLALLGGGKPKMEPAGDTSEGPERTFARDAFAALKDDDEEGFIDAFIAAVKACTKKAKSGGYEASEEMEDEPEY